jgi:c-di-GMP-binding flagellar brake protein YcgR
MPDSSQSGTNKPGRQQRAQHRFSILNSRKVKIRIQVLPYDTIKEREALLENFSAGGAAIRMPKQLPEQKSVYLTFTLPDGLNIACHGTVLYSFKTSSGDYQIGIKFIDLPDKTKNLILLSIASYLECGDRTKRNFKMNCTARCPAYCYCSRNEKNLT